MGENLLVDALAKAKVGVFLILHEIYAALETIAKNSIPSLSIIACLRVLRFDRSTSAVVVPVLLELFAYQICEIAQASAH